MTFLQHLQQNDKMLALRSDILSNQVLSQNLRKNRLYNLKRLNAKSQTKLATKGHTNDNRKNKHKSKKAPKSKI